jgi:hypothetical protein
VPRCTDWCTEEPLPIALPRNDHLQVRKQRQQAHGRIIWYWYTIVYLGGLLDWCARVYRGGPLSGEIRSTRVDLGVPLATGRCTVVYLGVLALIFRDSDARWLTLLLLSV